VRGLEPRVLAGLWSAVRACSCARRSRRAPSVHGLEHRGLAGVFYVHAKHPAGSRGEARDVRRWFAPRGGGRRGTRRVCARLRGRRGTRRVCIRSRRHRGPVATAHDRDGAVALVAFAHDREVPVLAAPLDPAGRCRVDLSANGDACVLGDRAWSRDRERQVRGARCTKTHAPWRSSRLRAIARSLCSQLPSILPDAVASTSARTATPVWSVTVLGRVIERRLCARCTR
jgi:hypothetical protein